MRPGCFAGEGRKPGKRIWREIKKEEPVELTSLMEKNRSDAHFRGVEGSGGKSEQQVIGRRIKQWKPTK